MRNYELMFIVRPNLEDEASLAVAENAKAVVEKLGAKVSELKNMGRRELAYEVKGFNNGNYYLITCEAEPKAVKEFDRVANISEDIIRHIVVNKSK